ncbi:MAG: carbonic anhydrase family protein [Rikenellaceae bacterium]
MKKYIFAILSMAALVACTSTNTKAIQEAEIHILRAEDLGKLTPDTVMTMLKHGNQSFISKNMRLRDHQAQLAESAKIGQAPIAIVLSCIDSRVPVETIFDMGIGDLFVARVAGNVVNDDMLASMEYACKYVGSKVVLVLGHESCGAVNAACKGLKDGNLTELMHKIHPAVELAAAEGGDPSSKEFKSRAVAHNVDIMVDNVRKNSEILAQLESEGKIKIVGGIFNLETGLVVFD